MPKLLTGWILKRKSAGAKSKILGDTNKRFFTLDFENQILFYSNSESQKKSVSLPIPFIDILSVEATGNAEPQDAAAQAPAKSGRFAMPKFPKMANRNSGSNHCIIVHGKDKKMELLWNSEEEASKWLAALQYAVRTGDAKRRGDSDPDLAKAEQSTAAGSSGASGSGSSTPRDCIPEVIGRSDDLCESDRSPPLSSGLEDVVLDADAAEAVESQPAFQKMEPHRSSVNGGYNVRSDGVRRVSFDGNAQRKEIETSPAGTSAWGNAPRTPPIARYADQGEGLSLKERLEQLNFSDDEDEEDGEKSFAKHTGPLKTQTVGVQEVARGFESHTGVQEVSLRRAQINTKTRPSKPEETVVEACEAFEPWDSDDES